MYIAAGLGTLSVCLCVGHMLMDSGVSSSQAAGCLFWGILEVVIPRGSVRTEPAPVVAGANCEAGLKCPHLSLLSGVGKSLLEEMVIACLHLWP